MTTEHVSANAEGMPEAQREIKVSGLLLRTMKRHDAARAYFGSVAYLSDAVEIGREATEAEKEIFLTASQTADRALADVCSFPSTRPADIAAKAAHLLKYHGWLKGDVTDEHVEAFLKSLSSADAGHVLSELIEAHAEAAEAICETEGDPDRAEVTVLCQRQCEIALAICGHRPQSKEEECQKAEFLRDWTESNILTEDEQTALIASLMPEGGAS